MSVRVSEARSIGFLLNKYKTKQPGEKLSSKSMLDLYGKEQWRMKQKIRITENITQDIGLNKNQQKQVLYLVNEIKNIKQLCRNCSFETIVTIISLHYIRRDDPRKHIDRYSVWYKENLSWTKYSRVIDRLFEYAQEHSFLKI